MVLIIRAVARALIGGGGCIFIDSGAAQLVSFEIKLISKEVSQAEPEYMNIHPPPPAISVLAMALLIMKPKKLIQLLNILYNGLYQCNQNKLYNDIKITL